MTAQHAETTRDKELVAGDFPVLLQMDTRWSDIDIFGHLNNAVYYQLFDSAINRWVIEGTGIQPAASPALPLVAESGCSYFREVHFPDPATVGITVTRLGRSSVTYRLGLLTGDASAPVAAVGRWVHVYVDPATRKSCPIPAAIRALLESIAP
jgi:acyl-CoA thioester hydrolase